MTKSGTKASAPKSTPPIPDSRNYLKKLYKDFWKKDIFQYKHVIEVYATFITKDRAFGKYSYGTEYIIKQIPTKLWLENKVSKTEQRRLEDMLNSSDEESIYMAITIMKNKAGGKM